MGKGTPQPVCEQVEQHDTQGCEQDKVKRRKRQARLCLRGGGAGLDFVHRLDGECAFQYGFDSRFGCVPFPVIFRGSVHDAVVVYKASLRVIMQAVKGDFAFTIDVITPDLLTCAGVRGFAGLITIKIGEGEKIFGQGGV